jgi:hypothetical protein
MGGVPGALWLGGATGRGGAASRPVAFLEALFLLYGWVGIAERAVRPAGVVVVFPDRQSLAHIEET